MVASLLPPPHLHALHQADLTVGRLTPSALRPLVGSLALPRLTPPPRPPELRAAGEAGKAEGAVREGGREARGPGEGNSSPLPTPVTPFTLCFTSHPLGEKT